MKDVALLCSGGLDSVVLGHEAGDRLGLVVFVDYGQPVAAQERASSVTWADAWGVPFVESIVGGNALTVLENMVGHAKPGPRVVPGRNSLLLTLAAGHAVRHGCSELWIGCTAADQADYPDCRPDFMAAMTALLSVSKIGLSVHAPLIAVEPERVLELATIHGVRRSHTWSCYDAGPGGTPCGQCNSCKQPGRAMVGWTLTVDDAWRTDCCRRTGREFEANGHAEGCRAQD